MDHRSSRCAHRKTGPVQRPCQPSRIEPSTAASRPKRKNGKTTPCSPTTTASSGQPSVHMLITPEPRRLDRSMPSTLMVIRVVRLAGNQRISVANASASAASRLRPAVRSRT